MKRPENNWKGAYVVILGAVLLCGGCFAPQYHSQAPRIAPQEEPFEFSLTLREIDFEVEADMDIVQIGGISAVITDSDLLWSNYRDANPRLDWKWNDLHLTLGIVGSEQSSVQPVTVFIDIGSGPTATELPDVLTTLEFTAESLVITKDFAESDVLEAGVGFSINHAKYTVGATSPGLAALNAVISESKSMVFPAFAFRLGWLGEPFSGEIMAQWISYDKETLTDIDLQLNYQLLRYRDTKQPAGVISMGYHILDYDVEYASDGFEYDTSFTFKGPWVGFTLPF